MKHEVTTGDLRETVDKQAKPVNKSVQIANANNLCFMGVPPYCSWKILSREARKDHAVWCK